VTLRPRVLAGEISRRAAVRTLSIGDGGIRRLLAAEGTREGIKYPPDAPGGTVALVGRAKT
jgi:hypothetical protein